MVNKKENRDICRCDMTNSRFPVRNSEAACSPSGTILVVDDEPAVCHVTGTMLELHGFSVLYAQSGEQALRLVAEYGQPIHLLVADIVMPRISGPRLRRRYDAVSPTFRYYSYQGWCLTGIFKVCLGDGCSKNPIRRRCWSPRCGKSWLPRSSYKELRLLVHSRPLNVSSATADLSRSPFPSFTSRRYWSSVAAATGNASPTSFARSNAMAESFAA